MSDMPTPEMEDAALAGLEEWRSDPTITTRSGLSAAIAAALAAAPTVDVQCPTCEGWKWTRAGMNGCPDCNGSGRVRALILGPTINKEND